MQNQKWVEKRKFLHFPPPSSITSGQIDLKEWKEILEFFKADLHWLLTLPHYKYEFFFQPFMLCVQIIK